MDVRAGVQGIVLPGPGLALDDPAAARATIVSHAHADHVPHDASLDASRRVHCTPGTASLLARRRPDLRCVVHDHGEAFDVGEARVTFHPSGHVLGAAFTRVEWKGETLLYTGDFKLRAPFTCAPAARGLRADVLVTESTFGLPVFRFPPSRALQDRAVAFAEEALAEGGVPVFLGWVLGKAQELARALGERGVPVMLHGAAWNLLEAYREHGVDFPNAVPYARDRVAGRALVVPPDARANPMVTRLKDAVVCYASGWAAIENRRVQMDADALLPVSDHADFEDLCAFVDEVRPARVVATHGYADVFAHVLRSRGVEAEALHARRFEEEVSASEAA